MRKPAREQHEPRRQHVGAQAALVERPAGALPVALQIRLGRARAVGKRARVEGEACDHRSEVRVRVADPRVVEVHDRGGVAVEEHLVDRRVAVAERRRAGDERLELGDDVPLDGRDGAGLARHRERDPRRVGAHAG